MKSQIISLLNIEYPIVQGGMAWVADYNLASAVSKAGGLGIIAAAAAPPEWVREQIQKVKEITDKPFGVNIMLMSPYAEDIVKVVIEENVPVVTTGAGNPERYMADFKKAGIKVIPVVASVGLARRMEKQGATAVIAEGSEAGGHIGDLTTMALVPQVCDAISIPVIGAGGVCDSRGAAAMFALGADAIQIGTRFVATVEANVHENYKEALIKAKDIDTRVTGRSTGHPVRALRNQQTLTFAKMEAEGATLQELEELAGGGLRKAVVDGDVKTGSVMAGQVSGLIKDIKSCKDVIDEIMTGYKNVLQEVLSNE